MFNVMKLAAVLLVASLLGQYANAGCLNDVKNLICRSDKSYEILAKYLYTATRSNKLADNAKAAEPFLSEHPDADEKLIELANAFKSLTGDESDPESLCSKNNLANIRLVAEAMRKGGNHGPKKIKPQIFLLNSIIINFITRTRPICLNHLSESWPKPWNPKFSDPDMKSHVKRLGHSLPVSFIYEGYMGKRDDPGFDRYFWGSQLSKVFKEIATHDSLFNRKQLDPDCKYPSGTTNKTVLALQVHEYVYKPCKEFVTFEEAQDILARYNDIIISNYVVDEEMVEYFENEEAPRRSIVANYEINNELKTFAPSYRACQRFLAMPERDVLYQLHKSRKFDQSN